MSDPHTIILKLYDAGQDIETIADSLAISTRQVYNVLQKHRPDRPRKPRACTSDIPRMIKGLAGQGVKPARIAVVLGVSRQYVYRHLPEASSSNG